jgi:DNA adenine methylase
MHFALDCQTANLSDLNGPLINFFKWLRAAPRALHARSTTWERNKETYLRVRQEFDTSASDIENAAMFYFLNANCFNGIYRTNKSNAFNVPYSGDRTSKYASLEEFEHFSRKLSSAEFSCCDFRVALSQQFCERTFCYIDPPYFVDDRRVFREYGPDHFSQNDLRDLSKLVQKIDAQGASFLISYADCDLARKVFSKWNITQISLARNIGGFHASRRRESELIITNYGLPSNGNPKVKYAQDAV